MVKQNYISKLSLASLDPSLEKYSQLLIFVYKPGAIHLPSAVVYGNETRSKMETVRTTEQVNTPGKIVPFSTETLEKQQDFSDQCKLQTVKLMTVNCSGNEFSGNFNKQVTPLY
jgi:hypothetical protein